MLRDPSETTFLPPQDALSNLVKRSQLHFLHCLDPGMPEDPRPPTQASEAASGPAWDIPTLRAQLSGSLILEALRLYRIGAEGRASGGALPSARKAPCRVGNIGPPSWGGQLRGRLYKKATDGFRK